MNNILNNYWNTYYHLPDDTNWELSSYTKIMRINTVEDAIALNENMPDKIIKFCMLFVMKNEITPLWEDPQNINGGCFSYKIHNKYIINIWKQVFYALCGETLTVDKENMKYINGITISPKKNFCILKIWITNTKIQNQ